ncbi:UNVERIFIED_ORG: hypothetical protein E4P37_01760 [Bacillus sp. AZ43]
MISDTDLEAGLRDLRTRADEIPPPPAGLAELTRARYRAQRRSRAAWAAGGLVAALVLVGVPVAASMLAVDSDRGQAASERTVVPSPSEGLYALPTRGSLADDQEWLAGITARDWQPVTDGATPPGGELPDPAVDTRRVAFAGDVYSGRVALVLGLDDGRLGYAWFTGPEGADAAEMEPASDPSTIGPDAALALLDAPAPGASETLVVVAHDGDRVDLGLTVVEASGKLRADRFDLPVEDGVAVVEAELPEVLWSWQDVRVHRSAGGTRAFQLVDSARLRGGAGPVASPGDVAAADPRGLVGGIAPEITRSIVADQLAGYGLSAEQAAPTLLAAAPVDAKGRYGELYGMTHPSGATSTWVVVGHYQHPQEGAEIYDLPPAPAGTGLLDRAIAVPVRSTMLVSAPGAGVRAELLGAAGEVLGTVPLARGTGAVPLTGVAATVTVRVLDADGEVVAEAPVTRLGK